VLNRLKNRQKEYGFGNTTFANNQRIINKDGSFNVNRIGLNFFDKFSLFHFMINSKWITFISLVVLGYFLSATFFAMIYYTLGISHFNGVVVLDKISIFLEFFFYSTQTFATVGYGRINPASATASLVSSVDSLTGVLYFAIVTGMLFARFSMPKTKILFAENAVVAKYQEGTAIMFRIANQLPQPLQNASVRVIASYIMKEQLNTRQYFELQLERNEIVFFATSWTIVHPITEESPFYNLSINAFNELEPEFLMQLKVYDPSYNQDVFINTSYRKEEFEWHKRYAPILVSTEKNNYIDFSQFNTLIDENS
jgi:inward rectifier potassium channel